MSVVSHFRSVADQLTTYPRTPRCGDACPTIGVRTWNGDALEFVLHDPLAHERGDAARRTWGPLAIDGVDYTAALDGEPLALTPTEWRIVAALIKRGSAVWPHEDLVREIWGQGFIAATTAGNIPSECHLLRVNVTRIRAKLGAHRNLVALRKGVGYYLAPTEGDVEAAAPSVVPDPAPVVRRQADRPEPTMTLREVNRRIRAAAKGQPHPWRERMAP